MSMTTGRRDGERQESEVGGTSRPNPPDLSDSTPRKASLTILSLFASVIVALILILGDAQPIGATSAVVNRAFISCLDLRLSWKWHSFLEVVHLVKNGGAWIWSSSGF